MVIYIFWGCAFWRDMHGDLGHRFGDVVDSLSGVRVGGGMVA